MSIKAVMNICMGLNHSNRNAMTFLHTPVENQPTCRPRRQAATLPPDEQTLGAKSGSWPAARPNARIRSEKLTDDYFEEPRSMRETVPIMNAPVKQNLGLWEQGWFDARRVFDR